MDAPVPVPVCGRWRTHVSASRQDESPLGKSGSGDTPGLLQPCKTRTIPVAFFSFFLCTRTLLVRETGCGRGLGVLVLVNTACFLFLFLYSFSYGLSLDPSPSIWKASKVYKDMSQVHMVTRLQAEGPGRCVFWRQRILSGWRLRMVDEGSERVRLWLLISEIVREQRVGGGMGSRYLY